MLKKRESLKNRGLVPTIQPEPDFSWTCGFRYMLDNVEVIRYMKFQKLLMTGCRDMDKKRQKIPPKWGFSSIFDPPRFFFKNRALSLLYPYVWCPNFMQKIRKILRAVSEIFKDGQTNGPTDGQRR